MEEQFEYISIIGCINWIDFTRLYDLQFDGDGLPFAETPIFI